MNPISMENASDSTSPSTGADEQNVTPSNDGQEEQDHVKGLALFALVFGLLTVIFIVTLDISIVATAIPRITDDFHTITGIGWYGSAYLITNCTLQPFAGRVYSFFPFKQAFLAFLSIFALGSLLCGISVSSTMLIVGRAVCGIGGSGLMNGAMIIVGIAAPPSKRSIMLGMVIGLGSIGQVVGPLIGGGLTQYASWRWCFYLNLPVSGVAFVSILLVRLPGNSTQGKYFRVGTLYHELDVSGFLIFAPACIMLLMGLEWGGTQYAWKSATVIGLLCGSSAMFCIFGFWERRQGERAMIPSWAVQDRVIYGACLTSAFQGASMLILTYYLAIWFQVVNGDSPSTSAISMIPNFVSQVLLTLISSFMVSKFGYVLPFLLLGNCMVTISYGLFSTLAPHTNVASWIYPQVIGGSGRGLSMQMPIVVTQASVEISRLPTASALVTWSQFFGGAVCLTLGQTLFQSLLRSALQTAAPQVNSEAIIAAGATEFKTLVPPEYQSAVLFAYNEAIAHTFYLGVGAAAASVCASLLLGTKKVSVNLQKTPMSAGMTVGGSEKRGPERA